MDPLETARRWATAWSQAWARLDADAVAHLYAPNAVVRTHPFRDPIRGPDGIRDYLRWSFAVERDVRCWYAEPIAQGTSAAVEYWATLVSDDAPATISGVSVLDFDAEGRVRRQRDTWVAQAGHAPLPEGWQVHEPGARELSHSPGSRQSNGHG